MFANVAVARRIERAEAAMSASMVGEVCRRSGTEAVVEALGEGYAICAGPGSPFSKIIGAGLYAGQGIGDHTGNFLSPFWVVVVAGIARVGFRTFFGYGVIFSLLWFTLGVGIFTFVP